MLKELKLNNVGPAATMELKFAPRLNLITGDNGLGKSVLLDISWWALTGKWPAEVNSELTSGGVALPRNQGQSATIEFKIAATCEPKAVRRRFDRNSQSWPRKQGRPIKPGLVFYAMSDGSFSVWDPERNYWRDKEDPAGRQDAYVFTPREVWDGLQASGGNWVCNGLLRDWAGWQKENGRAFQSLKAVLNHLSPDEGELLEPGALTRISLTEVRDLPTIKMPYGVEVPILHASAGMRRIIALDYFLVWCWEEHLKAVELKGLEPETRVTFLIDEVESHLHPRWQRSVIPSLLEVMQQLKEDAKVQLVAVTHSPLVMASVEPSFDAKQDVWFDLDLENNEVVLRQRPFVPMGDASTWLTSDAFDLKTARALGNERLVQKAADLLDSDVVTKAELDDMQEQLIKALNPMDDFLLNWHYIRKSRERAQ